MSTTAVVTIEEAAVAYARAIREYKQVSLQCEGAEVELIRLRQALDATQQTARDARARLLEAASESGSEPIE